MAIFGDSYCYADQFQQQIAAYHGMKLALQDCRVNRPIGSPNANDGIFECYGGTATGVNLGASLLPQGGGWGTCAQANNGTVGNTLAQDLAGVDLILIELGTNDHQDAALGTIADAAGTDSTYGYIQTAVQGLLSILPAGVRIVWLSPIQITSTVNNRAAMMGPITTAIQQVVGQYALPLVDNFHNSGFNVYSDRTLLQSDGIHPTYDYIPGVTHSGFQIYARYPTAQLNNIWPLD